MTGCKLLSSHVQRQFGDVVVFCEWLSPGGLQWTGRRTFPTLGHALDHLAWLYAEQRQAFGLLSPTCQHVELTTRWVDGKTETRCDKCGGRVEVLCE